MTKGRPRGGDTYSCFADLAAHEEEDVSFRSYSVARASPVAIIAPHGGYIEPGTSQIAAAIAAEDLPLYCFEGLELGRPHSALHIRSELFDEPNGCQLVVEAETAVAVHGRANEEDAKTVWLGGRDVELRGAIGAELERAGFKVTANAGHLSGTDPANICNRGRSSAGVQLEIPRGLRERLLAAPDELSNFAAAVRTALSQHFGKKGAPA